VVASPPTRTSPRLPTAVARAEAVRAAAARELDAVLADLARWVGRDTPSGDLDALDAFAHDLAATTTAYGYACELVPGPAGLALHARLRGRGRARVALVCHHDTCSRVGTALRRPFVRRDGLVLGPGVGRHEGRLWRSPCTPAAAGRPRGSSPGCSRSSPVPDEEARSAPFRSIARLSGFDAALVLECGRPGNGIVTARKGGRWLELHATGSGRARRHRSRSRDANAVLALCGEALRIAALDGSRPGTTVHVTRLHGGDVVNTVPSHATLTLDMARLTAADLDATLVEIARVGDHDGVTLVLETTESTPPLERVPALAAAARELGAHLGAPVHEVLTGGVSDGCWTAAAGIPTLDGLGPVGGLDHTPEEYAEVGSFAMRCGLVAGLVTAVEEEHR
jgi:glutamate carboxypeptidase